MVLLTQFRYLPCITAIFWIYIITDGAIALKCWHCSWDRDKKGTDRLIHVEEDTTKLKPTKEPEDEVIENPSVKPFYGKDTWTNSPNKTQLRFHCENCTIDGGACLSWMFRSSKSERSIQNFTRMCVRSFAEVGCYTQDMRDDWIKEVCLCKEDNCNGKSVVLASKILCFIALLIVSLALS